MDFSKSKQIRTLLYVLIAGVASALFLALLLLHYYSPTGRYIAKNVVLSPETLFALQTDKLKGGKKIKMAMGGISFSYYDVATKARKVVEVNQEAYSRFYEIIKDDYGMENVPEDVIGAFSASSISFLTLHINDRIKSEDAKEYIEIDFSLDDHYRVLIRQHGSNSSWAYFYHPKIYKLATSVFAEAS